MLSKLPLIFIVTPISVSAGSLTVAKGHIIWKTAQTRSNDSVHRQKLIQSFLSLQQVAQWPTATHNTTQWCQLRPIEQLSVHLHVYFLSSHSSHNAPHSSHKVGSISLSLCVSRRPHAEPSFAPQKTWLCVTSGCVNCAAWSWWWCTLQFAHVSTARD